MSFEQVKRFFDGCGLGGRVMRFEVSSATVGLAAEAVGCEPARIAKTLSFLVGEQPVLIVTAGDARVDNKKYKQQFHEKARMLPPAEVEARVGHAPGGVCPFAVREGVTVYLDVSLRRFQTVYPAAGSADSAVRLSIDELEQCSSGFAAWVDVCKDWAGGAGAQNRSPA